MGTLIGCGSSFKANPQFQGKAPKLVALLPIKFPESLRKPRQDALTQALIAEMKNGGYLIVDPAIVERVCGSDSTCPARSELSKRYAIDAYAEVEIDSASTNNFLAGYVDRVSGTLRLQTPAGAEILTAKHAETDAGGLLFNSGQVLTGLQTEVQNFDSDKFGLLANRFAKRLVSTVPHSDGAIELRQPAKLTSTEAKSLHPRIYEVCANGSPEGVAALSLGRRKTTLREVSPGRYCGIYRLEPAAKSDAMVELRSAYGDIARLPVAISQAPMCNLEGKLAVRSLAKGYEVDLSQPCPGGKVFVYRGDSKIGPYEKIGEIRGKTLKDSKVGASPIYQVISVSSDGTFSLPVAALVDNGSV